MSKNLKRKVSEIEAEARHIAAKRNWIVIVAEICVIFIFPIVIGILIQNMKELEERGIFLILILLIGAAQLLLGLVVLLPAKNEFFYFDHLDLKENYQELELKYERAEHTGRSVYHTLKTLKEFIEDCELTENFIDLNKIKVYCEKLVQTLVQFRERILGFTLNDRYSFAIYLYSPHENRLKLFHRAADQRLTPDNREWEPYEGQYRNLFF
jgi:hypothetical protein